MGPEVDTGVNSYFIRHQAVRRAIDALSSRRSHNHIPGYLALLQRRNEALAAPSRIRHIERFHEKFLRIGEAPDRKPYLQVFRSRGTGPDLLNSNIQGSYAPSSIRAGKPLSHVVALTESSDDAKHGVSYSLVENHWAHVLSAMLSGNKILAASLAIFLFRDRQLVLPSPPDEHIVPALREFLAIRDSDPDGYEIYNVLFEDDSSNFSSSDFEIA